MVSHTAEVSRKTIPYTNPTNPTSPPKLTNPTLSIAHAMCFEKALQGAANEGEMRAAAKKHAGFLLDKERIRLSDFYKRRLIELRQA